MFEAITGFFNSEDFMPHGHCFLWQKDILWLHVMSDAGVAFAYFAIPLVLLHFVRKRRDLPFKRIFLLFGAFILLCGASHLMSIWVIWHPDYGIEGIIKMLTAVASIATLIVLIKYLPQAILLVSPEANLLAAIVESSEDAIISKSLDGIISSWNKGAERLFGYHMSEAVGQHISLIIPDEKQEEERQIIQHMRAGRRINNSDTVCLHKNGQHVHVALTVSPIRDSTGRIIGASKVARDIKDRRESEEALRQSESKLRAVVDNVVDGIIAMNGRGIIEGFNPACERIFGYTEEEAIGQNINMLMPEPYHSAHDGYLENYHKIGIAKIIGIGREVKGRRKDGGVFPMDLSVSVFELEDGRHFSGIIRDISERKEVEKTRDQLRQAQKMEALGQLTGG